MRKSLLLWSVIGTCFLFTGLVSAAKSVVPFYYFERSPEVVAVVERAIDSFEKHNPNIEVDFSVSQGGAESAELSTLAAVGADLGVFAIDRPLIREWAKRGWLAPLDSIVESIGAGDFLPGAMIRGEDGHVYAMATTGNAYGFWLNTRLLDEAGVDIPTNFDELLAAVQAVHNPPKVYGFGTPTSPNKSTYWFAMMFIYGQGGDFFDRDGNVVFDSPEVLQGLRKYEQLLKYLPPGTANWAFQETIDAFAAERVAIVPQAGRLGAQIFRQGLPLDQYATVVSPPLGPVTATIGKFDFLAVSANTKDVDAALAFLRHFISGTRVVELANTLPGHLIPALHSAQELFADSETDYRTQHLDRLRYFSDAMSYAALPEANMGAVTTNGVNVEGTEPPPWAGKVFGSNSILAQAIQRMAVQGWSAEQAQEWVTGQLKAAVAEYRKADAK